MEPWHNRRKIYGNQDVVSRVELPSTVAYGGREGGAVKTACEIRSRHYREELEACNVQMYLYRGSASFFFKSGGFHELE